VTPSPRSWLAGLVMTALLGVTACSGSSSSGGATSGASGGGGSGTTDATVTIGATAEPETLDLTTTPVAAIPQVLLYNVYEGLVKLDNKGDIKPLLAKSYGVSKDGKTYTFHLQPDAKFSDGRPLTAADVVFSFNRVRAAGSKHPFAAQMAVVKSVSAKDAHTAVVVLKQHSNDWLYNMTSSVGVILHKAAVDKLATDPVGTGPYTFVKHDRGNSITLARNDAYWGTAPQVKTVVFRYFTDPNAMNNAMLSGDLDVISNVQAPQTLKQFDDPSRFTIIDGTTNGEVVLSLNGARGPLRNKLVRQAVNYAIDRKALVDTVWAGHGTLIGSMVPPTDPWYEDLSDRYPYDPQRAKDLLAKAGYAHGVTLAMKLPTLPYAIGAGQFVASQLKQVGITVKLSQLEFPARWIDVVFTQGDYDMSIIAHVEARDIEQFGNPDYYWHYDNPAVTSLLKKADAATSNATQVADMKKVARTISDDAAADWLFLLPNLIVTKKGVTGIPQNAVSLSFDLSALRTT